MDIVIVLTIVTDIQLFGIEPGIKYKELVPG